ncbi:MAG: SAM-dependent methyltransferase, partial [Gammaproteobacteria bacterium]
PGMLAVARNKSEPYAVKSEWHESSATDMPLPDGAFDNVYCQCAIMFFPDRGAAMSEMHRVLAPGGRLAANVWRSLERTPGFAVLEQIVANHVGDDAAAIVRAPFVIDTPTELHTLLDAAGFKNIRVTLDIRMVRFPSVEAFFNCYTGGSPLASHAADLDNREQLISEAADQLSPYIDDDGLAFPIEGLIVTANK